MYILKNLLWVDVESTDLDPNKGRIIEIACSDYDIEKDAVLDEWSTTIYNEGPLPEFTAQHFTLIELLRGFDQRDALQMLARRMQGKTIAGQNIIFDVNYIRKEMQDVRIEWPKCDYHFIDLCSIMVPFVLKKEIPGVSLKHTRKWAGIEGTQKHRAMDDVRDAIAVFRHARKRLAM